MIVRKMIGSDCLSMDRKALYTEYKELSKGVFRPLTGKIQKQKLKELAKRYKKCAEYRDEYQAGYQGVTDAGHQKIIDAAKLKAEALYFASLPREVIAYYGECLRVIYNIVVDHYNLTKKVFGSEFYTEIVEQTMYDGKMYIQKCPRVLWSRCIGYTINVCKRYMTGTSRQRVFYILPKEMSCEVVWRLMGFSEEPLVRDLFLSLGDDMSTERKHYLTVPVPQWKQKTTTACGQQWRSTSRTSTKNTV